MYSDDTDEDYTAATVAPKKETEQDETHRQKCLIGQCPQDDAELLTCEILSKHIVTGNNNAVAKVFVTDEVKKNKVSGAVWSQKYSASFVRQIRKSSCGTLVGLVNSSGLVHVLHYEENEEKHPVTSIACVSAMGPGHATYLRSLSFSSGGTDVGVNSSSSASASSPSPKPFRIVAIGDSEKLAVLRGVRRENKQEKEKEGEEEEEDERDEAEKQREKQSISQEFHNKYSAHPVFTDFVLERVITTELRGRAVTIYDDKFCFIAGERFQPPTSSGSSQTPEFRIGIIDYTKGGVEDDKWVKKKKQSKTSATESKKGEEEEEEEEDELFSSS